MSDSGSKSSVPAGGSAHGQLGAPERSRLSEKFGRSFEASASLYCQGDAADVCFILQRGRVRLVKRVRSLERSLTVLKPGDLFGEEALLAGATRAAGATALNPVSVLALDRDTFGELLTGDPVVSRQLVGQLVQRLRQTEEQLENAMLRDHPSRIVNTLIRMAERNEQKHADGNGTVLQVSPLDLSSRVGLDIGTVKRGILQLKEAGYLTIQDEQVRITDLSALRDLYGLLGEKEGIRGEAL